MHIALIPNARARLKVPALARAWATQSPANHRVEVELPTPELLLDDGPNFKSDRVLFVGLARETNLAADADCDRQAPRLREADARTQSPPDKIEAAARTVGKHLISCHLKMIGNAMGHLEGQMKLV